MELVQIIDDNLIYAQTKRGTKINFELVDRDSLDTVPTEFIGENQETLYSDIIWKSKLKIANSKKKAEDTMLFILLELQSSVNYTMVYRLFQYIGGLLNNIFINTAQDVRE
jgi:hypothetical protein